MKSDIRFRLISAGLALLSAISVCLPAQASDDYPNRPIRLIVPFPPAGSADVIARLLAQKMEQSMGKPFVVINQGGASGFLAMEQLSKSPADGYTIGILLPSTQVLTVVFNTKTTFDPLKSFTLITSAAQYASFLGVHPSLPVNSLEELIAYARRHPGKLSYASSGTGASLHLFGELLKQAANIDIQHIPYRGGAPALSALMAGLDVQVGVVTLASGLSAVKAGKVKAISLFEPRRHPSLPDVPAMTETLPNIELRIPWLGVGGPAGMKPEHVNRLYQEVKKAVNAPDVKTRLDTLGYDIIANTPDEFAAMVGQDIATWSRVVKAGGIKLEN